MSKEFRIYKPNRAGHGAASKFQCVIKKKKEKYDELVLFLESAKQEGVDANDNAKFAWSDKNNSVTMKLGLPDVGEMLLVLKGRKKYVGPPPKQEGAHEPGIYHQNQSGNTSLKMKWDKSTLYLSLSSQNSQTKDIVRVNHAISLSEAVVLETLLEDFIKQYHSWGG